MFSDLEIHFHKDHQQCWLSCTDSWNKIRAYHPRVQKKTDNWNINHTKHISLRMIQNSMNIPCLYKENDFWKWKVKKRTLLPTTILPPPLNKKMYIKAEIVNIPSPYKDRSPTKVKLTDEVLTKKLVPAGEHNYFFYSRIIKKGNKLLIMIETHVVSWDY